MLRGEVFLHKPDSRYKGFLLFLTVTVISALFIVHVDSVLADSGNFNFDSFDHCAISPQKFEQAGLPSMSLQKDGDPFHTVKIYRSRDTIIYYDSCHYDGGDPHEEYDHNVVYKLPWNFEVVKFFSHKGGKNTMISLSDFRQRFVLFLLPDSDIQLSTTALTVHNYPGFFVKRSSIIPSSHNEREILQCGVYVQGILFIFYPGYPKWHENYCDHIKDFAPNVIA